MALTNKGSKWEIKNSLYLIFSFIPFLNCIPFFHMNSRIKNKRWAMLGWLAIILQILAILLIFITSVYYPESPNYSDVAEYPDRIDYLTQEQKEKYYNDNSYIYSTEYKLSMANEQYEQAVNQYNENKKQWEEKPEIAAQLDEYTYRMNIKTGILCACLIVLFLLWLILLIISFSERPKYLKLLQKSENNSSITKRLKSVKENIPENHIIKSKKIKTDDKMKTDINSATEEELTKLKGITIIDAKKAIAYREEHEGFSNIDEFFSCINAKPHIIAANEQLLSVGKYNDVSLQKIKNNDKRKIDL